MAVLPMSKVTIVGLRKDRKKILEEIQRMGIMEVTTFEDGAACFKNMDTAAARLTFQKAKNACTEALKILERYNPEPKRMVGFLQGKKLLYEDKYYEMVKTCDAFTDIAMEIVRLETDILDKKAQIVKDMGSIEMLLPWKELTIPVSLDKTATTKIFSGIFPDSYTPETLRVKFNENCQVLGKQQICDSVYIEIVSSNEFQTCAVFICDKKAAAEVEDTLRLIGFTAAQLEGTETPAEQIKKLQSEIETLKSQIHDNEEKIQSHSKSRNNIEFLIDYYTMRIDKYMVLEDLGQSKNTFALSGFVPTYQTKTIEAAVTKKWGAAFEETSVSDEDNVPVLLKNGGFAAPLEGVLETFSLPGRGEIDPTAVMAIFYYFLFGLMLSDAGYGVLMVLICSLALWRFPNMAVGIKKALRMYLFCGVSTVFWGIMFGGYFGDAIQVISSTFFNREVAIRPVWFAPMDEPMRMLMFALLVGVIHLFAGLGMRFYSLSRAGHWKDAVYDTVFWYLLVGGAIVLLLSSRMFVDMAELKFILPPAVGKTAVVVMLVGAVGIVLTSGRSSKNIFKRLAKGLYGLYNITGYLSDILSYSRLLALGLATGVIANVFNKMGSMFGGGVLGAVAFTVVFVIGHTLNIGINLLGAYVHTNRLQFVEFFGKFYEGGGEKFQPFKTNTEYYEIKKD